MKNRDISAMAQPIFMEFGMLVQNGLLTAPAVKVLNFGN